MTRMRGLGGERRHLDRSTHLLHHIGGSSARWKSTAKASFDGGVGLPPRLAPSEGRRAMSASPTVAYTKACEPPGPRMVGMAGCIQEDVVQGKKRPPPLVPWASGPGNRAVSSEARPTGYAADITAEEYLEYLRCKLRARGVDGVALLSRVLRLSCGMDGQVPRPVFEAACREQDLGLSQAAVASIWSLVDASGMGSVERGDLVRTLRGPMGAVRQAVVETAFARLDADGAGSLDAGEVLLRYNAGAHPAVASGQAEAADVLKQFALALDIGGLQGGQVTFQDFLNYCECLSAGISNDEYFESAVNCVWLPCPQRAAPVCEPAPMAATAPPRPASIATLGSCSSARGLRLHAEEAPVQGSIRPKSAAGLRSRSVSVERRKVFTARPPLDGTAAGIGPDATPRNQADSKNVGLVIRPASARVDMAPRPTPGPAVPLPAQNGRSAGRPASANPRARYDGPPSLTAVLNQGAHEDLPDPDHLLLRLRADLRARGACALADVARRFRECPSSHKGQCSREQFEEACRDADVGLSAKEQVLLLRNYGSGNDFHYDKFVAALRGSLSEHRKAVVSAAFGAADRDGTGVVDLAELRSCCRTAGRQDATSSPDCALQHFLEHFEKDDEPAVKINEQDFIGYYEALSAGLPSDEEFELWTRCAWQLPK